MGRNQNQTIEQIVEKMVSENSVLQPELHTKQISESVIEQLPPNYHAVSTLKSASGNLGSATQAVSCGVDFR